MLVGTKGLTKKYPSKVNKGGGASGACLSLDLTCKYPCEVEVRSSPITVNVPETVGGKFEGETTQEEIGNLGDTFDMTVENLSKL